MVYALVDGEKIEALPKKRGLCPLCLKEVFSKCGRINTWHWSHFKSEACDSWQERDSVWKTNWLSNFDKSLCEAVIVKNKQRRFADVHVNGGVLLFQNYPILGDLIENKEHFFGKKLIWVINGVLFKENFDIYEDYFKSLLPGKKFVDGMCVSESTGEILFKINNGKLYQFEWKHPRRSWTFAQRPVLIDFGEDLLFLIKSGVGTKDGTGTLYSKQRFINRYKGT